MLILLRRGPEICMVRVCSVGLNLLVLNILIQAILVFLEFLRLISYLLEAVSMPLDSRLLLAEVLLAIN